MIKSLTTIPRKLNRKNIDNAISTYQNLLKDFPISITSKNPLELLIKVKREKMNLGPYPKVTLFEAANRIMTDLTILLGIKKLLEGEIKNINFDEYMVELGNENNNDFDITAINDNYELIGEGFNVAKSFFNQKKYVTLKKMRKYKSKKHTILLLIYNADAVSKKYIPKPLKSEFYLPIKLEL